MVTLCRLCIQYFFFFCLCEDHHSISIYFCLTRQYALKTLDEVSLFQGISSFRRVAIHRFHCSLCLSCDKPKSVRNSEVSSLQGAICTENSLGPAEVSVCHRISSFHRVASHRFHCSLCVSCNKAKVSLIQRYPHFRVQFALKILDDVSLFPVNPYFPRLIFTGFTVV
jgi:hypothetical protein